MTKTALRQFPSPTTVFPKPAPVPPVSDLLARLAHAECGLGCGIGFTEDASSVFSAIVDEKRERKLHRICMFLDNAGSGSCMFCNQSLASAEPQGNLQVVVGRDVRAVCAHDSCRRGKGSRLVAAELTCMVKELAATINRGAERLAAFGTSVTSPRFENQVIHLQELVIWLHRTKELDAAEREAIIAKACRLATVYLQLALDTDELAREAKSDAPPVRVGSVHRRARTITQSSLATM